MNTIDDTIELYVIGPGFGECVLLVFGRRIVIGMDCCSAAVTPSSRGLGAVSEIVSRLANPKVYWVLTHFHYDHFQGFSALIDQLGEHLQTIIAPGAYTSGDLADDVALFTARELRDPTSYFGVRNEFVNVKRALMRPNINDKAKAVAGRMPLLNERLVPSRGSRANIRVDVIGPSLAGGSKLRSRALNERGAGRSTRALGNESSYMLRVSCGQFHALLLGDALARQAVALGKVPQNVSTLILKVAHHGAADGTSREMLDAFHTEAIERLAIICPFVSHRLPVPGTSKLLRRYGFRVVTTGPGARSAIREQQLLNDPGSPIKGKSVEARSAEDSVQHFSFRKWGSLPVRKK